LQLFGGPNPPIFALTPWSFDRMSSNGSLKMGDTPISWQKKQIHWYTVGFGSYIYIFKKYQYISYIYIIFHVFRKKQETSRDYPIAAA
jgi:hypothetical protein